MARGEAGRFAVGLSIDYRERMPIRMRAHAQEHERDEWLTYIDVLTHVTAAEATTPAVAAEASSKPNPALMLKFREEIARSLGQDSLDQDVASNENNG